MLQKKGDGGNEVSKGRSRNLQGEEREIGLLCVFRQTAELELQGDQPVRYCSVMSNQDSLGKTAVSAVLLSPDAGD